jgi:hypothetical protein
VKIRKEGEKGILEPLEIDHLPEGFWDDSTPDPEFRTPEPLPSKKSNLD